MSIIPLNVKINSTFAAKQRLSRMPIGTVFKTHRQRNRPIKKGWLYASLTDYRSMTSRRGRSNHLCTRPEPLPPAKARTSFSDAILKSYSVACFRQLAATANSICC